MARCSSVSSEVIRRAEDWGGTWAVGSAATAIRAGETLPVMTSPAKAAALIAAEYLFIGKETRFVCKIRLKPSVSEEPPDLVYLIG